VHPTPDLLTRLAILVRRTRVRATSWVHDPVLAFYPSSRSSAAPRDCAVSIRTRALRYRLRGGRHRRPNAQRTHSTRETRRLAGAEPTRLLSGWRPQARDRW
jgi:hypothetical protein